MASVKFCSLEIEISDRVRGLASQAYNNVLAAGATTLALGWR